MHKVFAERRRHQSQRLLRVHRQHERLAMTISRWSYGVIAGHEDCGKQQYHNDWPI